MLFLLSFAVLPVPTGLQLLLFKIKAIRDKKSYFILTSLLNILLQFIVIITSFALAIKAITGNGSRCATGAVGMFFFGGIAAILLLLVITIQFAKRKK